MLDLVGGGDEGDAATRQRRPDAGGPVLLAAKIDDAPGIGQTTGDPPLIRARRFMLGSASREPASWIDRRWA